MKIQVKGRNVAVTDALQDYAEEKISRSIGSCSSARSTRSAVWSWS